MLQTYTIVDDSGLLHDRLRELLHDAREVILDHATGNRVDFVWLNTGNGEDKRVFTVKAALKNSFDDGKQCITNKLDLSQTIAKRFPEIAARHLAGLSQDMHSVSRPKFGVFILKPAQRGFFSGHGIEVVSTAAEFAAAKRKYAAAGVRKVLMSEYIADPLLMPNVDLPPSNTNRIAGDYKFHLRMYWLVNLQPYFHKLWAVGKILTATLPYVHGDWSNHDIHDSHVKGSLEDLYFPTHFPANSAGVAHVWSQMLQIVDCLAQIFRPNMRSWPEADSAYEVFGLDFMVRRDLTVVLLELNDKVGFGTPSGSKKEFSAGYIDWVYSTAIAPYFAREA